MINRKKKTVVYWALQTQSEDREHHPSLGGSKYKQNERYNTKTNSTIIKGCNCKSNTGRISKWPNICKDNAVHVLRLEITSLGWYKPGYGISSWSVEWVR